MDVIFIIILQFLAISADKDNNISVNSKNTFKYNSAKYGGI